uniref:Uncharacterized protein n=1 Tax=Caenorhabditis japonica TaxID=281687 RepID=A0A8R1I5P9_CAEJA
MMTRSDGSNSTPTCTPNSRAQVKLNIQYDLTPRKLENDEFSNTPLIKKLFLRKLAGSIHKMNTGAYRPKASVQFENDDQESGVPQKKKKRKKPIQLPANEAQKYGIELSDSESEEENTSPSRP